MATLRDPTLEGASGGATANERRRLRREHGIPPSPVCECRWCADIVERLTGSGLCRPCDRLQGIGGREVEFTARRRRSVS